MASSESFCQRPGAGFNIVFARSPARLTPSLLIYLKPRRNSNIESSHRRGVAVDLRMIEAAGFPNRAAPKALRVQS